VCGSIHAAIFHVALFHTTKKWTQKREREIERQGEREREKKSREREREREDVCRKRPRNSNPEFWWPLKPRGPH